MTDKERIDYLESLVLEITGKLINTQAMMHAQHGAICNLITLINPDFVEPYQIQRFKYFSELRPKVVSRYKNLPDDMKVLLQSIQAKDYDSL